MSKTPSKPPITQNAGGSGNIQVAGDNNIVHQEVTSYIPDEDTQYGDELPHDFVVPTAGISQSIAGNENIQVLGNNNFVQKIIRSIRLNAEQMREMRNRRIMLEHVNNFWVKGILEQSLHDTALLELGMKEDPHALKYPWTIKKEANKELLPAGTSMFEIFQEIGLGRSLLILGEPGAGKTTMLLELARQVMDHSSQDMTEPVPVVFNLSSWTENLSLADWLIQELKAIYYLSKAVATTWVRENKMFLLLDGLDEVRQQSRNKCVEAINQFKEEHGITGIALCCRIRDYSELKTRLSFDGAVVIQPLTTEQVNEYFEKSGSKLEGVRQALEKDTALREMAETPLFLSIITLAYKNEKSSNILVSNNLHLQRRHLFDAYIERMFERPARSIRAEYQKSDVLRWLAWLAKKMHVFHQSIYLIEGMQPEWLEKEKHQRTTRMIRGLAIGLIVAALLGRLVWMPLGTEAASFFILFFFLSGWYLGAAKGSSEGRIHTVDILKWNWSKIWQSMAGGLAIGIVSMQSLTLIIWLVIWLAWRLFNWQIIDWGTFDASYIFWVGMLGGAGMGVLFGLASMLIFGVSSQDASVINRPGERLFLTIKNSLFLTLVSGSLVGGMIHGAGLLLILIDPTLAVSKDLGFALSYGLIIGLIVGTLYGGLPLLLHYSLRLSMNLNRITPWRLVHFLNHCVDLIFLRRVGGGYIFVHRLLMEHFAAMYHEQK